MAGSIRQNYEKYLYPYEVFLAKRDSLQVQYIHIQYVSNIMTGNVANFDG